MIDKITPRPDPKVQKMLEDDGFEDNYTIITEKRTYTAPFVNAEETEYLVGSASTRPSLSPHSPRPAEPSPDNRSD